MRTTLAFYYSISGAGVEGELGLVSKSHTSRIHACISTSCGVRIDDSTINGCSIICSGVGLFMKSLIMLSNGGCTRKTAKRLGSWFMIHIKVVSQMLCEFDERGLYHCLKKSLKGSDQGSSSGREGTGWLTM